jgi:hypothetical protein
VAHYRLDKFIKEDREEFPHGRTFAVKRALLSGDVQAEKPDGLNDIDDPITLKVLNASPEEYVLSDTNLARGLQAAKHLLYVEQFQVETINRCKYKRGEFVPFSYPVEVIRFAGTVALPSNPEAVAVGAYVPGEASTSFLHMTDPVDAEALFSKQPITNDPADS